MKIVGILLILFSTINFCAERSIVVIIPSYCNSDWYQLNLNSVFAQKYQNFRVIYIDDSSHDNTAKLVKNYIDCNGFKSKVTLISNRVRVGAMANLYNAIHSCSDDEIVVILDGDDWFAHDYVLEKINDAYDSEVLLTYGNYVDLGCNSKNIVCSSIDINFCKENFFNYQLIRGVFVPGHLKTFYARIFKKIYLTDLLFENKFFPLDYDVAINLPMFKIINSKFKFIPEILYIHNVITSLNDHKCQNSNLSDKVLNVLYDRDLNKYNAEDFNKKIELNSSNISIICDKKSGDYKKLIKYVEDSCIEISSILNIYDNELEEINSDFVLICLDRFNLPSRSLKDALNAFDLVYRLDGFLLNHLYTDNDNYIGIKLDYKFFVLNNGSKLDSNCFIVTKDKFYEMYKNDLLKIINKGANILKNKIYLAFNEEF